MKSNKKMVAGVLAVLLVAVGIWLLVGRNDQRDSSATTSAVASVPTPRPTPVATPVPLATPEPEETPEPEPVLADTNSIPPTPTPEVISPNAPSARIYVLESGSLLPMERLIVRLQYRMPEGGGEVPVALRQNTDAQGKVEFRGMRPGEYDVLLRWGQQAPQMQVPEPLVVPETGQVTQTYQYTARTAFKFQLRDLTDDKPIAHHALEVGIAVANYGGNDGPPPPPDARTRGPQGASPGEGAPVELAQAPAQPPRQNGWQGGFGGGGFGRGFDFPDTMMYQQVETDLDGRFTVLGYEGMRPVVYRSKEKVMYSRDKENGWGNPASDRRALRLREEDTVLYARRDVVHATGLLLNAPKVSADQSYVAVVRAQGFSAPPIPVKDNEFTFTALPSSDVNITLTRTIPLGGETGGARALEKRIDVKMPAEAGDFVFEIPFEERLMVTGMVYMPNGDPAKGVSIRAVAFGQAGGATAATGDANARGDARFVSVPTGPDGRFQLSLAPAAEYLFAPESRTLPPDAKGSDPLALKWERLATGEPVVLTLKFSSLVWGTVVDEHNQPVANASVNLRGPGIPFNSRDFTTQTTEDGTFEMNIPPTRLLKDDPNEAPSHYVFAYHAEVGGGLGKATIDNAEEPVNVVLAPFTEVTATVTEGGLPVKEIEFAQLYDVPGFARPIDGRQNGTRRNERGEYKFRALLRGVSSLNLWKAGAGPGQAKLIQIPDTAPANWEITVELSPAAP